MINLELPPTHLLKGIHSSAGETQWKLLSKEESTGMRSAYFVDSDGSKNKLFSGQRVRLTVTTLANGLVAPVMATMTGYTSEELPEDCAKVGFIL